MAKDPEESYPVGAIQRSWRSTEALLDRLSATACVLLLATILAEAGSVRDGALRMIGQLLLVMALGCSLWTQLLVRAPRRRLSRAGQTRHESAMTYSTTVEAVTIRPSHPAVRVIMFATLWCALAGILAWLLGGL